MTVGLGCASSVYGSGCRCWRAPSCFSPSRPTASGRSCGSPRCREIYVARVAATPKRAFLYGWLDGGGRAHRRLLLDGRAARALRPHGADRGAADHGAAHRLPGAGLRLLLLGPAAGLGPDRRAAGAAGAAGHGRRRAPDAADLPLLPGHLAGVRAGGHPDRRRRPGRSASRRSCWRSAAPWPIWFSPHGAERGRLGPLVPGGAWRSSAR